MSCRWWNDGDDHLGERITESANPEARFDVQVDDDDVRPTGIAAVTEDELPQGVRDLLADETTWAEPAPGGADALLAAIRAEPPRAADTAPPPPAPVVPAFPPELVAPPVGAPPVVPLERRRRGRGLRVLAAAAVLAVVVGVVGALLVSLRGDEGGAAREVAIAGTELAPEASAVATVEELGSGAAIELDVSDLAPAPPGTYYQALVRSPDEELVSVGTFHMRAGDEVVELWAGVDLDEYPTLTVTIQQEDAGPESSGEVVLRGEIG
jgi:hypothetical protein